MSPSTSSMRRMLFQRLGWPSAWLCTHARLVLKVRLAFEGMADYQYVLPVHADAAKSNRKRRREEQRFGKFLSSLQDSCSFLRVLQILENVK